MKKILLGLILCLLMIPSSTLALKCSKSQKSRYEKLASQISTTYDYEEINNNIKFTITFHNVHDELYLVDYYSFDNLIVYKDRTSENTIVASNYDPNKTYKISILNKNSVCDSEIITRMSVTLPNYNKYSKDPLCSGYEDYSLCQKWSNIGSLTYDEFKKSMESYIEGQAKKKEQERNTVEDTPLNRVRNFIASYYPYLVLGLFVLFITIALIYKKRKHNSW